MNRLLLFFCCLFGLALANFSTHGFVGNPGSDAKSILEHHLAVYQEVLMKKDLAVLRTILSETTASHHDYVLMSIADGDYKTEVKDAEFSKNGSKDYIKGNVDYYEKKGGGKKLDRQSVVAIKKYSESPSGYRFTSPLSR